MSKMISGLSLSVSAAALVLAAAPSNVEFNLTTVEDSTNYLVYRYDVVVPASSAGGVTSVEMDVSASLGTPQPLASSGTFRDWTGPNPQPFAEVGPDVPPGWKGTLTSDAHLRWHLPTLVDSSPDSVPPGDTVSLAIRSSYLPGLRVVRYAPTVESCCLAPIDTTEEHWLGSPLDFQVPGVAVGPRYQPSELDIELVRDQLDAVCDDPLWIDDTSLCAEVADSLAVAESRYDIDNYFGARQALQGAAHRLDVEREPSGEVQDNAFFLLDTNIQYLLDEVVPSEGRAEVLVCAGGPSAETVPLG